MVDGNENIGRRMAAGAGWMVLMRLCMRGIGLVSMVILARLLVPDDFGLIVLATTFVGILEAISELGFEIVLIRDRDAPRAKYDSAWTLSVIRGVSVATIIFLSSDLVAGFWGDPRLVDVMLALSAASLVDGFRNVGVVDFRKHLTFDRDFLFRVTGRIAGFVVTIALAALWRNYWALVAGILTSRVALLVASYSEK